MSNNLLPNSFSNFLINNSCVLIPTYNNSKVLKLCLNSLHKLNPQPKYYVILENNCTDDTVETIAIWKKVHPNTIDIHMTFDKDIITRLGTPYGVIAIVRQTLLDTARKLNVNNAIFIDDDILIDNDKFIREITKHKVDLLGIAYFRSYPSGNMLSYLDYNNGKDKENKPYVLRNYQLFKRKEVLAVGGGCMCIGRKILKDNRVNFYPIYQYINNGENAEDYAYCLLARKYGYKVFMDDRYKICHYQVHKEARPWRMKDNGEYIDFEF